ncbi:amino acid adenylation domain-containing protein [Streptomyces sp. JH002]|uniref:amino acid adenylation domain-containing protein n=1 Tax=Streptomyces sp. JH002 TaxID=2763259 RepID=UPI003D80855A
MTTTPATPGARIPGTSTPAAFSAMVARDASAPAVIGPDGTMSYGQLAERARRYGERLASLGIRPGARVALELPRGTAYMAALLGAWHHGAVVVPIDSTLPAARCADMLRRSCCTARITQERRGEPQVEAIDRQDEEKATDAPPDPVDPTAYILFTSGSTGRPKGVAVGHTALTNLVRHFADSLPCGPATRTLWLTATTFDISLLEILLPLTTGGTVSVPPADAGPNPAVAARWLAEHPVSVMQATPTWWGMALPVLRDHLTDVVVLSSGEALPSELARQLAGSAREVWNVYGPTEATIHALTSRLAEPVADPVPIGRPITGMRAVLARETPLGERVEHPDELLLSGVGLAQGYVGDPETTDAAFLLDDAGVRHYRTGDLCVRREDGTFGYLGRKDHQVKILGHRVELEEIERAAENGTGVNRAIACVLTRSGRNVAIDLAIVPDAGPAPSERDVKRHLAGLLPSHMIPRRVVPLDHLPRTASGKADRTAVARLVRERIVG